MISFEKPARRTYTKKIFRWWSHGLTLGQNMVNLNVQSDMDTMATVVHSITSSKNWFNLKAMYFGNTKISGFLHPLMYLFSYSRLTIWTFDNHKSGLQTALMTRVVVIWLQYWGTHCRNTGCKQCININLEQHRQDKMFLQHAILIQFEDVIRKIVL